MSTTESRGNQPQKPIRIAVVEDETLMRAVLQGMPEFTTTGAYSTVEELLDTRPDADVVILDLWIRPETDLIRPMRGVRAIKNLRDLGYPVLLYTSEQRRLVLVQCLAAGADGVILKYESREALVNAITTVAEGEVVLTTALTGLAELSQRRGQLPSITGIQLEVLRGRARGEPIQDLAKRLHISTRRADKHIAEIKRTFTDYLRLHATDLDPEATHSPAVMEQTLGLGPGDLLSP